MIKIKGGELVYKCRGCGKTYSNMHVPDIQLALLAINNDWNSFDAIYASQPWLKDFNKNSLYDIHICEEFHYGVADLIGGRLDK